LSRALKPYNLKHVCLSNLFTFIDFIFFINTSLPASFTVDSSENKRIINSEEITIEDFTKNIDD
jgi:hypothetical protein